MRAVTLTGHGGLEALEYRTDWPVPVPQADEVLIAISACGLNNTDINTRTGWYAGGGWGGELAFPRIQGADPVGRIAAVGDGVDPARIGERVLIDAWIRSPSGRHDEARYLGSEVDGGFAEYVAVPAANAHRIETSLTDVELASFPCSFATAEHMLHRADPGPGDTVLVTGASGGVGTALIQLAKRRETAVLAITTPAKTDAVLGLGADLAFDRSDPELGSLVMEESGGGVEVFADVVGGPLFPILFDVIKPRGHYVTAGAIAGATVPLDLRTLYLRDITMHGATALPPVVFENLVGYIERGEVKPVIASVYPLEELAAAQQEFMQKEHVGAIVVEMGG